MAALIVAYRQRSPWVCQIIYGEIVPIMQIEETPIDDWVSVGPNTLVYMHDRRRFLVYDQVAQRKRTIEIPSQIHPTAIAAWRQWLYLAGTSHDCPVLLAIDVERIDTGWHSFYPTTLTEMGDRKLIDALIVNNDHLIAVDNVLQRKFVITFDLILGLGTAHIFELKSHGTWEVIKAAAADGRWLALLSTTTGMDTSGKYISIVDLTNLKEYCLLGTVQARDNGILEPSLPGYDNTRRLLPLARSIALLDEMLLVACETDEVAIDFFVGGTGDLRIYEPQELSGMTIKWIRSFAENDSVLITGVDNAGFHHSTLIAGSDLRAACET